MLSSLVCLSVSVKVGVLLKSPCVVEVSGAFINFDPRRICKNDSLQLNISNFLQTLIVFCASAYVTDYVSGAMECVEGHVTSPLFVSARKHISETMQHRVC